MIAQEETSIARGCISDQTTTGDIGAIVDQIIKESCAIDRIKFAIRIIQSEHFAIDETIPDDLSIVGRFIGGSVSSIVQTGKRPCGSGTGPQDECGTNSGAVQLVKVVVCDGVAKSESPYSPIWLFGVSVRIMLPLASYAPPPRK